MNYYPHHIGDFNNATRHLTRIERSIYRDMLDLYYDTETPLTLDMKALCRKLIAHTEEESTAVEQVLNEYFTKTEQGWHHSRCEEVIQDYYANISAKSAAGKASAAKRQAERLAKLNGSATPEEQQINGCSSGVQQPLESVDCSVQLTKNQEPITNNHKPEEKQKSKKAPPAALPQSVLVDLGVPAQVVADWYAIRTKKRLPLTQTALDEVIADVAKTNMTLEAAIRFCCKRGWASFEAEWMQPKGPQPRASPGQLQLQDQREADNKAAYEMLFGKEGEVVDAET